MMKKIWILLLIVSSVIGAIPVMANPLQDSMQTSDASNWKNIGVSVTGANWANNAIGQTLTSTGAQTNNLHDVLAGSGNAVGLASATASVNAPATSGNAANTDNLVDSGCGCDSQDGSGSGAGVDATTVAKSEDNKAHADANGLEVKTGDADNHVDQSNKVSQEADAKINNKQNLIQVVKIKDIQASLAKSNPEVQFDDSVLSEGNTMMGASTVASSD